MLFCFIWQIILYINYALVMHMRKVRTTINLNEDVVKKAKNLGINISAVAEMGILNYIKELENIGSENKNSNSNNFYKIH